MVRKLTPLLLGVAAALVAAPASAAFHVWKVKEIYSNADGSVQYVELFSNTDFQTQLDTHVMTATSDGQDVVFTFEGNLSGSTANRHILIATPGYADLPGAVTPDYVLDCGPFFDPEATSITIDFAAFDSVTFSGAELPTDGTASLTDSDLGAGQNLTSGASSPTNFANQAGAMALTGCLQDGTCDPCDDGAFCNGPETCSVDQCVPGLACPGVCDEDTDTCGECDDAGDCNDQEACTTDTCEAGTCVHTDNDLACDDGLFCTATDACAGGTCVGTGDACPGENCLEASDVCGDCDSDPDCDDTNPCTDDVCTAGECNSTDSAEGTTCPTDGTFCNGAEACSAGVCASPGDPCEGGETCDEGLDTCVDDGVGGGGGGTTSGGGQGGDGQGGEGAQVVTVGIGGGGAGGEGAQVTTGIGGGGGSNTGGGGEATSGGGDGPSGSTSTVGPGAGPGPSSGSTTTTAVATGAGGGGGGDGASGANDEGCGCEAVGADRPLGAGAGLAALGALVMGMRRRRRA